MACLVEEMYRRIVGRATNAVGYKLRRESISLKINLV